MLDNISINQVFLIGSLVNDPVIKMVGQHRITTLNVTTVSMGKSQRHKIVVSDEFLVQPLMDALKKDAIVKISGELDYVNNECIISVLGHRGCNIGVLSFPKGSIAPSSSVSEKNNAVEQPVSLPVQKSHHQEESKPAQNSASVQSSPVTTNVSESEKKESVAHSPSSPSLPRPPSPPRFGVPRPNVQPNPLQPTSQPQQSSAKGGLSQLSSAVPKTPEPSKTSYIPHSSHDLDDIPF